MSLISKKVSRGRAREKRLDLAVDLHELTLKLDLHKKNYESLERRLEALNAEIDREISQYVDILKLLDSVQSDEVSE